MDRATREADRDADRTRQAEITRKARRGERLWAHPTAKRSPTRALTESTITPTSFNDAAVLGFRMRRTTVGLQEIRPSKVLSPIRGTRRGWGWSTRNGPIEKNGVHGVGLALKESHQRGWGGEGRHAVGYISARLTKVRLEFTCWNGVSFTMC